MIHMDDKTQSLCHKPLHCSNLARCLLCSLAFASLPPSSTSSLSSSSSSFSLSQVSGGFLARTTSVEEVTHIRRHLLDHIAANICEHFLKLPRVIVIILIIINNRQTRRSCKHQPLFASEKLAPAPKN